MKKLLITALLASVSLPADAATYVRFAGTGTGVGYKYSQVGGHTLIDTGPGTFSFEIIAIISDGLSGCFGSPNGCGFSGSKVTGSVNNGGLGFGGITLNFDGPLSAWPTNADHFLNGSASGVFGSSNISTEWSGVVTSLTVGTFELPTTSGRTGTTLDFRLTGSYGVPEPASWAMMIAGFGLAGAAMRRRRAAVSLA